MVRIISEADVDAVLDVSTTIDLLDRAVRALAEGRAGVTPRERPGVPALSMNLMGAVLDGRIGHKCYPVAKGGKPNFVVTLYGSDGKMLALIQADRLGAIRTGAASGLATKYMAPADAAVAAIIGTGRQARTQIEAVCRVRPIRTVRAWGRNPENLRRFCDEMSAALQLPVEPANDVASAAHGADVVTLMTSASEPLLTGEMLAPGMHLNAAGSNRATSAEIDAEVVRRAEIIAVEHLQQARTECGDLLRAEKAGVFDWSEAVPLSEIVTGGIPGRHSDDQITLFESLGIALWDIAAASYVYDACRESGRGRDIDLPL